MSKPIVKMCMGVSQGRQHYVGERGDMPGAQRFEASAPAADSLLREYSFSVGNVAARARTCSRRSLRRTEVFAAA